MRLPDIFCGDVEASVPGAVPVLVCHDEVVVECHEDLAEEAKAWLERAMIDGMRPERSASFGCCRSPSVYSNTAILTSCRPAAPV
jgi:hypothetical protein